MTHTPAKALKKLGSQLNTACLSTCALIIPAQLTASEASNNSQSDANKDRPNIILLLCDDGGYGDWGFQGSKEFKTPQLDKLAKSGVIFDQMYVAGSTSGPSRAAIMTGKFPARFGYEENNVAGFMSDHSHKMGAEMGLPLKEKTIANYLHEYGYKSALLGKWHMGATDELHPYRRGFDYFMGFRGGARDYFPIGDNALLEQPEKKLEFGFAKFEEPKKYLTYQIGDEACDYIEKNKDNPFFLFVSFNAIHGPLQATKEDVARFPNLKGKRRTLAAMAYAIDKACGQIVDKVHETGLSQKTMIIFCSDNGGPTAHTTASNHPLRGEKATQLEGGIRVPGIISFPRQLKKNTRFHAPVCMIDLLPTSLALAGCAESQLPKDIDGVNIMPYLTGQKTGEPHDALYWKCETRATIRHKQWKFERFADRPAELYDIEKDPSESNNLAAKHPDIVKSLYKKLFAWEMTLERPRWMLKRKYEKRVIDLYYDQKK